MKYLNISDAIDHVAGRLGQYRFHSGTERLLQDGIGQALLRENLVFLPEYRLSAADRIDFYLPNFRFGIECKVDGGPSAVWEQLARYAQHREINGLILVSRRRTHAVAGDTVGEKPFRFVWVAGQL